MRERQDDYLLDSNHIGAMVRRSTRIIDKISSLPPRTLIKYSVISMGEWEFGHRVNPTTDQAARDEYDRCVNEDILEFVLEITSSTRFAYAEIMGRIWEEDPPSEGVRTERHLALKGVDINDVWIAATAMEHNLVLVTADKMCVIKEAAGRKLRIESWI